MPRRQILEEVWRGAKTEHEKHPSTAHFSTLYKEPKHGALMTLVTDAGYSSHDETIWESSIDVNGAACEIFSGDSSPTHMS